jgi:hypothetical protein
VKTEVPGKFNKYSAFFFDTNIAWGNPFDTNIAQGSPFDTNIAWEDPLYTTHI